jgi:tetratricopeptide (TPR) repeat protein
MLFDWGQMRDAVRYFRSFKAYDYFYTSQAELYLGRIYEALGQPDEAVEHYDRFVTWWQYADPPLQPLWEEGREALARLSGEPRDAAAP